MMIVNARGQCRNKQMFGHPNGPFNGCCHVTCCQLRLRQGDVGNSGEHGNLKLKLYYTCVEGETSVRERSRNAEDDQSPDIV